MPGGSLAPPNRQQPINEQVTQSEASPGAHGYGHHKQAEAHDRPDPGKSQHLERNHWPPPRSRVITQRATFQARAAQTKRAPTAPGSVRLLYLARCWSAENPEPADSPAASSKACFWL